MPGVKFTNRSVAVEFSECCDMKPITKSECLRAAERHAEVYSGVIRLPSLLISAIRSRALACGGGPSLRSASSMSVGLGSLAESERAQGAVGEGSKV